MISIPISIEESIIACWFSATLVPSDLSSAATRHNKLKFPCHTHKIFTFKLRVA
jgi:hypothetical protein